MSASKESSGLFTPTLKLSSRKRKITDLIEGNEASPANGFQGSLGLLSSTLNESISSQLENLNLFPQESSFETSTSMVTFTGCKLPSGNSPKLGSPERSQILYPNLKPTTKRRLYDFKRSSPVKKKLFNVRQITDPVKFFCETTNCEHIIKKVFKALEEKDLYSCSKVSKGWKSAVMRFESIRLKQYKKDRIMNKENYVSTPIWMSKSKFQSTPINDNITDYTNSLTKGQHLQHCHSCGQPTAIVQQKISQCSRESCGFIICLKCNSCSSTGPENFNDACKNAMLVVEKPRKRPSLLDSPKFKENSIPFFHQDYSHSTLGSSGYGTELDLSTSRRASGSFLKDSSHILKSFNEIGLKKMCAEKRPSPVVPVIPMVNVKKLEPDYEPSSPPKVKFASICSKKSKRALKRL